MGRLLAAMTLTLAMVYAANAAEESAPEYGRVREQMARASLEHKVDALSWPYSAQKAREILSDAVKFRDERYFFRLCNLSKRDGRLIFKDSNHEHEWSDDLYPSGLITVILNEGASDDEFLKSIAEKYFGTSTYVSSEAIKRIRLNDDDFFKGMYEKAARLRNELIDTIWRSPVEDVHVAWSLLIETEAIVLEAIQQIQDIGYIESEIEKGLNDIADEEGAYCMIPYILYGRVGGKIVRESAAFTTWAMGLGNYHITALTLTFVEDKHLLESFLTHEAEPFADLTDTVYFGLDEGVAREKALSAIAKTRLRELEGN